MRKNKEFKFDPNEILHSFKSLEDMIEKSENNLESKLNRLLDTIRGTEKEQSNPDELFIKEKNYNLVKNLLDDFRNGQELTRRDMVYCNKVWRRYK